MLALCGAGLAAWGAWSWWQYVPISFAGPFTSRWIVRITLSGGVLIGLTGFFLGCCYGAWRCLDRIYIDDQGIHLRKPIGSKRVLWDQVSDFSLSGGTFPEKPSHLVLYDTEQQLLAISLALSPAKLLHDALERHCPFIDSDVLSAHRPVPPQGAPSYTTILRGKVSTAVIGGTLGLVASLFFSGLVSEYAVDYVNYLRIRANPAAIRGEIREIRTGQDTARFRVTYRSADGVERTMTREVPLDAAKRHKTGDSIPIEHVAGRPHVARIQGMDLDGRAWIMLAFIVPFAWGGAFIAWGSLRQLFEPISEHWLWLAMESESGWVAVLPGAHMESLYAVFRDRHEAGGAVVVKVHGGDKNGEPPLVSWEKALKKENIQTRFPEKAFLCLGGDEWRLLLSRLVGSDSIQADYIVTRATDLEEVERWALRTLAAKRLPDALDDVLREAVFVSATGSIVGPLTKQEMHRVFNDWMVRRIGTCYDNLPPADIAGTDYRHLLGMNVTEDSCRCYFQRFRDRTVLWMRCNDDDHVTRAELQNGRWEVMRNLPQPRAMQSRGCASTLFMIPIAPLLLFLMAVRLLVFPVVWPIRRWEESRKQRKLAAARDRAIAESQEVAPPPDQSAH